MTLPALLNFVSISPGSAGDPFVNQVQSLLGTLYGSSSIMREAFDERVQSGVALFIDYVPGVMRSVREVYPGTTADRVEIDPTYADSILSIDQNGNVSPRGFPYMFLHELSHAIFELRDPNEIDINTAGFDFLGDNVRKENIILDEMGITSFRMGYFAAFSESSPYLSSYTGGAEIEFAFKNDLERGFVDASVSMPTDSWGWLRSIIPRLASRSRA